jgi:type IV pilus assembly protein PilY1
MMRRIGCIAVCLLAMAELARPGRVAADETEPDLREVEPYFMLVIDTSGSMELRTDCACTSTYCEDCLPKCQQPLGSGLPAISQKNRWAVTLEALTGTFEDFKCTTLQRTPTNGATYDVDYYLPYHQPWNCPSALPGTPCTYDSVSNRQKPNGILDLYGGRVRFGLMTFDGIATYVGANEEVPKGSYNTTLAQGVQGLWSYGRDPEYAYPGCKSTFKMNTGVRSAAATEGGLISLNSCPAPPETGPAPPCPPSCSGGCPSTAASIADDIQASLLRTRPYGGTPIAGALDDLLFHLQTDVSSDPFGTCRKRYALLLTDGRPDADSRPECACNEPPNAVGCPADGTHPQCPYPQAWQLADKLVGNDSAVQAQLERLFVVGMAVEDKSVQVLLDELAKHGCPGGLASNCNALFAADFESLMNDLGSAIDQTLNGVSRSVPAFAPSRTGQGDVAQYMISTGFRKPTKPGEPWYGLLERKRYTCVRDELVEQRLSAGEGDLFHQTLEAQKDGADRYLVTAALKASVADYDAALDSSACDSSPCATAELKDLDPPRFGAGYDEARVQPILDWMTGASGSPRDGGQALGDIYHSSPVVLSAPIFDTVDEGFNLFRREPIVARRPVTVFVNSNDGILHAFSVEDYKETIGKLYEYSAGQEMWGFVPPLLINDLKSNLDNHQTWLDGTPLIKDVYFDRSPGRVGSQSGGDKYHTVLITGMRGGGKAYIALDITNVHEPKFLWQFTDSNMGYTYGQAAIGQATWKQANGTIKHGAVALLPGGKGSLDTGECGGGGRASMRLDGNPTGSARSYSLYVNGGTVNHDHRTDVRCWDTGSGDGRSLYIVDVETGALIKKIRNVVAGTQPFPSPMVGTPAMYQTDIGTVASRAFMVDADGWVWRIDLSAIDPKPGEPLGGWTALPFHDMFYGADYNEGEYSYEAPVLSVDPEGHVVVLVGTGDTDDFVKPTIKNRVASLTEIVPTLSSTLTPLSYKARLNWEMTVPADDESTIGLRKSELVTGSMALYQGTLFFGTFISLNTSNSCDLGKGRLHAVDYVAHDESVKNDIAVPNSYGPKLVDVGKISVDGTNVLNVLPRDALKNFMAMGLSVVQRPTCASVLTDESGTDLWGQNRAVIKQVQEPSIYLVSQASGTDSHVARRSGSQLGTMELKLNRKPSYTRITSWAGSVD